MAKALVSEELWGLIEPLIPKVPRRHRLPGRKRLNDRKVLTGILFVCRRGFRGRTCRRRWAAARVLLLVAQAVIPAGELVEPHGIFDFLHEAAPAGFGHCQPPEAPPSCPRRAPPARRSG